MTSVTTQWSFCHSVVVTMVILLNPVFFGELVKRQKRKILSKVRNKSKTFVFLQNVSFFKTVLSNTSALLLLTRGHKLQQPFGSVSVCTSRVCRPQEPGERSGGAASSAARRLRPRRGWRSQKGSGPQGEGEGPTQHTGGGGCLFKRGGGSTDVKINGGTLRASQLPPPPPRAGLFQFVGRLSSVIAPSADSMPLDPLRIVR